jgi:hypothetical protein
MIGGLGIGTTNPQYSLHVSKGSIQAYNFQQFEWINTQSNNRLGYNPATSAGLYKVATLGTTSTGYGMINVRGQIGGFSNSNTMYVDVAIMSRGGITVWGTVYGNQSSAALQCDVVYCLNTSSQYDIYIHIKSATTIVYDLVVSGASGSNVLYDPVAAAMIPLGALSTVSVSGLANIYSNSGNVGIGKTASTVYKLDVDGIINASQYLQGGVPLSTGGSGGSSQWITSGLHISYLLGNVGIGTATPSAPLHLYGTTQERIRLDTSSATQTYILFASQGNNRGYIGTGAAGADITVAANSSQNLIFQAGGSEYMRITNTGNVGIGTNNPSAILHVLDTSASSSSAPFMTLSPNLYAGGSQYLYFGTANSPNNSAQLGWCNVGAGSTSNYAFLQINGKANIMTWQASSGNVGIGKTNPTFALDVVGDVRVSGSITSGSTNIMPMGIIVMWSGSTSNVPSGWLLCNGTNGTPNLMDRFVVGAGSTYTTGGTGNGMGGSNTVTLSVGNLPNHTHTVPDHTHSTPDHSHSIYDPGHVHGRGCYNIGVWAAQSNQLGGYTQETNTLSATTGITINSGGGGTSGGSGTLTSGGGSGTGAAVTIIPLYYALCYIMKS